MQGKKPSVVEEGVRGYTRNFDRSGRNTRNKRRSKLSSQCPTNVFIPLFPLYVGAHTLGGGHYAKMITAKKIWTLVIVRQRLGFWMNFCRDKEDHWLPTQWLKQPTFVKRWESPLNGDFAEEK